MPVGVSYDRRRGEISARNGVGVVLGVKIVYHHAHGSASASKAHAALFVVRRQVKFVIGFGFKSLNIELVFVGFAREDKGTSVPSIIPIAMTAIRSFI